jgi:hypothetical protein
MCADDECMKFCTLGFSGMFLLISGIMAYFVVDNGNLVKSLEDEMVLLGSARPATCSFSREPGTPDSVVLTYNSEDANGRAKERKWTSVECAVTVSYVTEDNDDGSIPGSVFAGDDRSNAADHDAMCRDTLSGPWPNIIIQGSWNQAAFQLVDSMGNANAQDTEYDGWACGKRKIRHYSCDHRTGGTCWVNGDYTCYQDKDKMQDGGTGECTIDKTGQVRLGTAEKQVQDIEKRMEAAEASGEVLTIILGVFVGFAICVCGRHCCIRHSLNKKKAASKVMPEGDSVCPKVEGA